MYFLGDLFSRLVYVTECTVSHILFGQPKGSRFIVITINVSPEYIVVAMSVFVPQHNGNFIISGGGVTVNIWRSDFY